MRNRLYNYSLLPTAASSFLKFALFISEFKISPNFTPDYSNVRPPLFFLFKKNNFPLSEMLKKGTFKVVCFSVLRSFCSFCLVMVENNFFGGDFNKHTVTLQVISWGMKRSCRLGFGSHLNCCCFVRI